ncbi:hypothetical protein EVAR_82257_1 [Eumeta japonica]|uniref:VPS9 domain-containing protein n=1 Tax=Eumeta variegata TaxID=151549 RepID=A0A4C1W192_EUMVA|nr:hypothetical protein EVAR_82257_1 [Eumeta japonica]
MTAVITELLGMDGAASPGGKLARVRRCCGHVLALAADAAAPAPASADDLLPALIFTVLKANPPRLISNINFVTRFCNAARLMTGESGYYFTNLCCAVSFIENMTAESLGMDKEEFDCYMAMPASIGGSAWAATLSLCAELREAEELSSQADQLRERVESAAHRAQQLRDNTHEFENEITNKVHEVLSKTPLEIKPRREVSRLGKLKNINTSPLIDLELAQTKLHSLDSKLVDLPTPISESSKVEPRIIPQLLETEDIFDADDTLRKELGFEVIEAAQAQAIREEGIWETKHTDSAELLTPSPLGFPPFDCRSLDEAMTPDEFGSERLVPGLSAVNYDIDLSDFSADNSVAEDVPSQPPADPFSPEASKAALGAPTFEGIDSPVFKDQFTNILDSFDQLSLIDANAKEEVPFEVVHKVSDPFSPIELKQTIYSSSVLLPTDFSAVGKSVDSRLVVPQSAIAPTTSQLNSELTSLLDKNDSPVDSCLLPSPLQPQNTGGVDKVS